MKEKLLETVEALAALFLIFDNLIRISLSPTETCFSQLKQPVCFHRWSHYTIDINRNEQLVNLSQQNTEISIFSY